MAKKLWLSFALCLMQGAAARADIILTHNVAYTQNFNTLASTGSTGSVLPNSPNGWTFIETGGGANTTYGVDPGASGTANTYSYGSTGSTERAFGSLGNRNQSIGARFQHSGLNPHPFTKVIISYTGEQWRLGALNRIDRLDFQISTDATSLTTGTWTDVNVLDFIAPITTGSTGALNGNLIANRTTFAATKIALPTSVSPGATFWIRWSGFNSTGNDDGLAIDDFSITAIPESSPAIAAGGMLVVLVLVVGKKRRQLDRFAEVIRSGYGRGLPGLADVQRFLHHHSQNSFRRSEDEWR